ncbi:protein shisa-5 isoform X20 [Carassius gibelio]|uniref:protein shisa-5 isoform X19 n=1 Tax=Carassius gibelio TaxID=101364 RepID=UPI002278A7A4|nr:protein shisa-5 isoform X19 [Carassius gibelio]XP_052394969.1 protein shisa-5 isoform X20 [Carassius gibelio]
MASASAVLLLLSAGLFTVTDGADCESYYTSKNKYRPSFNCGFLQHCCGTCNDRFCCPLDILRLSKRDQNMCNIGRNLGFIIGLSIAGFAAFVILFICCCCCCCPCCCFYQTCRRHRTAVQTNVTTVMNSQSIQMQPVMQVVQPQQYQPVPTQAGYGGQPMQTAPYQGQSYAPEPPPSYDMATSPGYPTIQGAYNGGQAMYPMKSPDQPGAAPILSETLNQPAYNPDYMQPPKTGY